MERTAEQRDDPGAGTILVIDDEEVIREGCVQVLSDDGHRVETADDAARGIERASAIRPDVVLLDIRMPGMSGLDAIGRLLEHDPSAVLVMITGYATVEYAVQSLKSGAFDFLAKPFTPLELRRVVRHALGKRRMLLEMERLREDKRKMAEQFVSVVSQRLRHPLTVVAQYFEALFAGPAGEVSPQAREILERAGRRLSELTAMIDDWLALARHDREDVRTAFRPLDLGKIVRRHLEFLDPTIRERGLRVEIDCPPDAPRLEGDERSIGEAFSNLVTNAVKYNRPGGTITVRVRAADARCCVEVCDTGIGIPPEQQELVFHEFHRVRSRETENIRGTGLGLAIVRRIAETHGGSVELESEAGKGSTFRLWLPARPPGARASPPGDASRPSAL